ncbi:MAG: hypothetical protein OXG24_04665 [Gammaproteobacteria bacterium]|nr:hypothetical protein [Gammaproteobacteria bacterium]
MSNSWFCDQFKFATCVAFVALLLGACGIRLEWPDKEKAPVYFVNFSPNTEHIAARHYPNFVTTSTVDSREEKCEWFTNYSSREPIFTPSGELLLIDRFHDVLMELIGYHSEFVFYDVETCKKVRSYAVAGKGGTYSLEFSNGGEYLVRGAADTDRNIAHIQQIESDTGQIIREWNYENSHGPSVALSSDESLLAIGLAQHKNKEDAERDLDRHIGRVILVDFTSGEVIGDWIESETNGIAAVDTSSDGELLALGFRDGTVKVLHWRSETPTTITQLVGVVDKLMISPDDSVVFFRSREDGKRLFAYRLDSGEQVHEFEFDGPIHDFDISADSETLVVGSTRNTIKIVDLAKEIQI